MLREKVKFLLVDDEEGNLSALRSLLARDGLECLSAHSGAEALELLLKHDFALALLDVQLPDMNGFELAELMRGTARTRRIPIIFLTAVATNDQRRFSGYEAGAVDYLIKPVDPEIIRRKAEVFFDLEQQRGELVRQRDELRKSEERFRHSLLQAPTPALLFNEQSSVLVVNEEWLRITGYERKELATLDGWARRALGPQADELLGHLQSVVAGEPEKSRVECELTTKGGAARTWVFAASALEPSSESGKAFILIAHDITDRKQAEKTQLLLMAELNHRVKNTLATVQSIARQTLAKVEDPKEFAASFTGRIAALSRAHSILSSQTWQGADIKELVRDQLSISAHDEQRISISGLSLSLQPQHALHLALMLHELATNASKYGALSNSGGRVSVGWTVDGEQLCLRWKETGGPKVVAPARRGFGTNLIAQTTSANGGMSRVDYAEDGVEWKIRLPLDQCAYSLKGGRADGRRQEAEHPTQGPSDAEKVAGKRLLLVEDEPLVALDLAAMLEQAGAHIVGPVGTVEEALKLVETMPLDGALLDGNLHGSSIEPVAAALASRQIPFVFVTGYGREDLPCAHRTAKVVMKPFGESELLAAAALLVKKVPEREAGVAPKRAAS